MIRRIRSYLRGEPDLEAPVLPPPRQQLHLGLLEEPGTELAHLAREQEAVQRVEEAPALLDLLLHVAKIAVATHGDLHGTVSGLSHEFPFPLLFRDERRV